MKKWLIAIIGSVLHLFLGTVYAWSYFQGPLLEQSQWNNTQIAWTFSLSIFMLGISAAWAGIKLPKYGARKLAFSGALLYAIAYIISAYALKHENLWLLYIGFGLIGGTGLGLAYVTPVATVSKWFDKHQGLATGMVVMGFGLGALVMSKLLAPYLMQYNHANINQTFLHIGIIFLVVLPSLALFIREPASIDKSSINIKNISIDRSLIWNKQFGTLWLMFLINIIAGMVFIAFQSPLLQDLLKVKNPKLNNIELAAAGASLIAISSLFNGLGRFTWASISDKIGRLKTFRILLLMQALIFAVLIIVKSPIIFSILVSMILLCYGGGFGIAPSLIKSYYGEKQMSIMYGILLTAWSLGGILGPQLVAIIKDNYADQAGYLSYIISGILLFFAFILSFRIKEKS